MAAAEQTANEKVHAALQRLSNGSLTALEQSSDGSPTALCLGAHRHSNCSPTALYLGARRPEGDHLRHGRGALPLCNGSITALSCAMDEVRCRCALSLTAL